MRAGLFGLGVALALVACQDPGGRIDPEVMVLGRDRYFDVVVAGDRIVTGRTGPSAEDPDDKFAITTWESWTSAGGQRETLTLPAKAGCVKTRYVRAFAIDAKRVGFQRQCSRTDDVGRPAHVHELVSYDVESGRLRTLTEVEAAAFYVRLAEDDYLAAHDSEICTRLQRYRGGEVVPLGMALATDGWPLDADRAPGEEECRSYGLVTLPAVSSTGEVAFLASTAARGKGGLKRARAEHSVYLVRDGIARPIATAPGHPRALTWSADGSTLYMSVDGDDGGVYSVTRDGTLTLLTSTVAHDVVAQTGSLVMIEDFEDDALTGRLVLLRTPA